MAAPHPLFEYVVPNLAPMVRGVPVVGGGRIESEDRLGDHQPNIVLHPIFEATRPPLYGVGCRRAGVDPHTASRDRDREGPHIVGEGVEGAAAGEVEPGVMPVAGEDSVADGASVEGETHVGASGCRRRRSGLPRGNTAMVRPPPVTTVQRRARTSSTVPASSRRWMVVVIGHLPMDWVRRDLLSG